MVGRGCACLLRFAPLAFSLSFGFSLRRCLLCRPRCFLCVFPLSVGFLVAGGGGGAGRSALAVRARQALAAVLGASRCGARSLSPCTALAPSPSGLFSFCCWVCWLFPSLFWLGSVLPRAFAACLGLVAAGWLFLLFGGGFRSRVCLRFPQSSSVLPPQSIAVVNFT